MGKELIKYEEGFFSKLKKFFSNLFKKGNDVEEIQYNSEEEQNEFRSSIEIKQNKDELKIINLQKQYKAGNIKEEDMADEERKKLIELYKTQNEALRNEIEEKKIVIQKKIASLT